MATRRRCIRRKRVRVGGRMVLRCAKFSGTKKSSSRVRRRKSTSARRRKPAGMARRGSKCVRFKRVRVRGGGVQRRCASYSGAGKRKRSYRRKAR